MPGAHVQNHRPARLFAQVRSTAGLAFSGTFATNCFMTTLKVEDPPENLID